MSMVFLFNMPPISDQPHKIIRKLITLVSTKGCFPIGFHRTESCFATTVIAPWRVSLTLASLFKPGRYIHLYSGFQTWVMSPMGNDTIAPFIFYITYFLCAPRSQTSQNQIFHEAERINIAMPHTSMTKNLDNDHNIKNKHRRTKN